MSASEYIRRLTPHIEKAARIAEEATKRISASAHIGWQAYVLEYNRLVFAASDIAEKGYTKSHRWATEEMNQEEFENYLLSLGVWVDASDEEDRG